MADPRTRAGLQPDPAGFGQFRRFAAWIALSDGVIDRNGKPVGTDFSNIYAAGTLTLEGRRRRRL